MPLNRGGMLPMEYEVETLDGLSEDQKGLYKEVDGGKFRLNVTGLPEPEDTRGLKSALKSEREISKVAKDFQKLGKSPEEIQALIDAQEAAEQKRLHDEGNFEKIMEQHREKAEADLAAARGEATQAKSAMRSFVGEGALTAELARQGATEEGIRLLPREYMPRLHVDVDGEKPSINVMMPDGETPMAGDSESGIASVADLVAEAVKSYPSLFRGAAISGGGKPAENKGGKPALNLGKMSGSKSERVSAIAARFPDLPAK